MKIRILIEAEIDIKEYYNTYRDYYVPDEPKSMKVFHKMMKDDMVANAQYGVQQWGDRLSFKTLKIKDKVWN